MTENKIIKSHCSFYIDKYLGPHTVKHSKYIAVFILPDCSDGGHEYMHVSNQ